MEAILELIQWSAQPDNKVQKLVYKRAQECSSDPQFIINLTSFLISNYDLELKYRAAVILKAVVRYNSNIPPEVLQILMKCDPTQFKSTFLVVVPEIVIRSGLKNSQPLLQYLIQMLDYNPEIATDCLSKIIEDLKFNQENIYFYDSTEGLNLMDQLIQRFLQFTQSDNPVIVGNALNFLNYNVYFMPPGLAQNSEIFVQLLLNGCKSQLPQIRLKGFQGLHALVETKRDKLNNFDLLVKTCVDTLCDEDKEVVKYAELFLTDFLRIDDESDLHQAQFVKPYLAQMLPFILLNLQITKTDQINLMPTFSQNYQPNQETDDEDDKEPSAVGEYTLRKVSEQLLEKLNEYFEVEMVQLILPMISELVQQLDWRKQEVGIVSLGIMANQIISKANLHLQQIITLLFEDKFRTNEYIYASVLWSISKYHPFLIQLTQQDHQIIVNYLRLLIQSIEQPSLIVKESACTALTTLAQDAYYILKPYLIDLFQVYVKALEQGEGIILYIYSSLDSLLQECDSIDNQQIVDLILGNLIMKLTNLNNYNICPLYGCIATALSKFQEKSIQYLGIIYEACKQSIAGYVNCVKNNSITSRNSYQQKEILKRALEVCSEIIAILKTQFIVDQQFLNVIDLALQDPETDVRQYVLSIIGDLIKNNYTAISHGQIAQMLNNNIYVQSVFNDPQKLFLATSNNAAWAMGELALKDPQKVGEIINDVMGKLCKLVNEPKLPRPIAQNLGIAIIRIISTNLELSEPFIKQVFKRICLILSQTKSEAFEEYKQFGLIQLMVIVQKYPTLIIGDIKYFVYCEVVSNMTHIGFTQILRDLKQSIGEQKFEQMFSGSDLPQGFRQQLQSNYNI